MHGSQLTQDTGARQLVLQTAGAVTTLLGAAAVVDPQIDVSWRQRIVSVNAVRLYSRTFGGQARVEVVVVHVA